MFNPGAKDEQAALVFDDLASAIDAGLPLPSIGGDPDQEDEVLAHLTSQKGVKLDHVEKNILRIAWKSGNGAASLRTHADNRRHRARFKQEVWGGLRYPIILCLTVTVTAFLITPFLGVGLAGWIGGITLLVGISAAVIGSKIVKGAPAIERIPFLRSIANDIHEIPYLETLQALYGAGIPIAQANKEAIQAVGYGEFRDRLQPTQATLANGGSLRDALTTNTVLNEETRTILITGEDAGDLEDALRRAIIRRQEVARRRITTAATRIGQTAYALAVIASILVIFKFYGSYIGLLGLS